METITIGTAFPSTGTKPLAVSRLALGIGGYQPAARAYNHAQLDRFVSLGGSLVDTALVYGKWIDETKQSYSEMVFGEWIEAHGTDKIFISTKGAHPELSTMHIMRVTPEAIAADLAESLAHLHVPAVDLYFLHRDDVNVPVSVIMDELNRQAAAGRLNLLGASNWSAERIYRANDYCVQHGMRGIDVSQICFNILRTTKEMLGDLTLISMDEREQALYRDLRIPVMAFTSQAHGYVSKFFNTPDAEVKHPYANPATHARMARIREVCRTSGLSSEAVTMGYLLSQDIPVIPIFSTSKEERLTEYMGYSGIRLTREQLDRIDGK